MTGYFSEQDCNLEEFKTLIDEQLDPSALAFADAVEKNIPVYHQETTHGALATLETRRAIMAEWAHVLGQSSGVVVLKGAMNDLTVVDEATAEYNSIIEEERAAHSGGDHFGERGANDRVWNSLQKLCLRDPKLFARYFSSPAIAAVSEAWLGPWYQMTAQVNLVRPGGKAQTCHRDYHLGFMTQRQAESFPAHSHLLSASLTLQGAVAHCDMPVESGPTKLLPNSQRYGAGYVATLLPEFREFFEERHVQLPLEKGDAVFFNPALFHAAGENRSTDIHRMANLLQISSPMGRSLERIDRTAMVRALYPVMLDMGLSGAERAAAIAAAAEGYPFPTNLDTDPPIGGLASESQAELLARALDENMDAAAFEAALEENRSKRLP
jgi:ectoine hydroxylase-related dioxygenase (phytanoyl-CoA dioxygenase family)